MTTRKGATSKARQLVLTSVAFQDHITRTLLHPHTSLSDPFLRCRKQRPKGGRRGRGETPGGHDATEEEREYVLDAAPPPLTLACGRRRKETTDHCNTREQGRCRHPPSRTCKRPETAQRMGLVGAPAERLTEDDWIQVKARSVERGDLQQPCAICREPFRLQPQVLLSCSHVFHRECLHSFERFSGRKRCPMCRREQYETRAIHDAARLFRNQCATRIQACWRGYVARKWYKKQRKSVCPRDKRLRRQFFEARLQELNDSFVRYCHTDTEAFLSDIDRSLSASRQVFQQLERRRRRIPEPRESDWDQIQKQVIQRDVRDCPICLTALCSPRPPSPEQHRRAVLLSCSHLFHQLCLDAFEAHASAHQPTCPLCRSLYRRKLL